MKLLHAIARRTLIGRLAALLAVSVLAGLSSEPALAHGDCPFCSLPVLKNKPTQDNETVLKQGTKRVHYRCVYCALSEAASEYKGNLTIIAPSEKKGKPVVLKRTRGKWSVSPRSAVFVGQSVSHRHCQVGYRALTSRAAFAYYVRTNKKVLSKAKPPKPLSLAEMVAISK